MGNCCCNTQVAPEHTTVLPSSTEGKYSKSSVKVDHRRVQKTINMLQNSHERNVVVPVDAKEAESHASTSRGVTQSGTKVRRESGIVGSSVSSALSHQPLQAGTVARESGKVRSSLSSALSCQPLQAGTVLPIRADSASSDEDQEKSPLRLVKVSSKKSKHGSNILRTMQRKGTIFLIDPEVCQFIDEIRKDKMKNEMEVVPLRIDTTTLPHNEEKAPVKPVEVSSKKRRCVSAILKKISRKRAVVPTDIERPQVLPGTSRETSHILTEDKAENTDNTIVPDDQKQTSGTVVSVETRRTRRISDLLKSIEEKQALAPQDFMGPEVCGYPPSTVKDNRKEEEAGPSQVAQQKPPETLERVESKGFKFRLQIDTEINQIFYREEEFVPHDEGSWEEYESYFPEGIRVAESRHTMASTVVGSYIAEVGDTDVEQQQKAINSKEKFPDAIEVQQWELKKLSSTVAPVVNLLYLAPPTSSSSDEGYVPRKRKKKKRKRRYY
ncbi:uncharacterized protein LOC501031 isoform X8 [Rattus norvegicus]|uniref:uncharacterized protein LOC501031 isoform X8 n=1 Tax=Rattus norvegicus TaxID=10116 RepID=UPI001916D119|nr:uncharacterized protein LOC501031 isoform X6 [Rattus norvegicus]